MITKASISADINFYSNLVTKYENEYYKLPPGELTFKVEHGKKRPYIKEGNKRKYINKKCYDLRDKLIAKQEISSALQLLGNNVSALQALESQFTDLGALKLPVLNEKSQRREVDWDGVKCGNPKYEPGKHIASDGVHVRSRAELAFYEFMLSKGIDVRYERPLWLDGQLIYPDFTIRRLSDNVAVIWEHFGMMNDERYRENAFRKIIMYLENGFIPNVNLIMTFDYGDDEIDLITVEGLLKLLKII